MQINHIPGVVTLTDANTTIGYCRYNEEGEVEYIFIGSAHRRQGHARRILSIVEQKLGRRLRFQEPISPLGRKLVERYLESA